MADDDLAARLAAVEDRLAIIDLEAAYARAFDSRDGKAWAALFTPDGVYQARGASPSQGNYVTGRADLAEFCTKAPFDGIHLLHLPQVSLDGDTASSRLHLEFVASFHADGSPSTRMVGYYDVRYVRCDGRWLIEHRVTTTMAREDRVVHPYPEGTGFDGA
jgi:uncharacterized protein (TIGR02246 family)